MRIPNLGDSREKKNERLGAQRRRSGLRRPKVGFPWCSRVPITVGVAGKPVARRRVEAEMGGDDEKEGSRARWRGRKRCVTGG